MRAGLLQLLVLPGQSERLLAGAGIAMSTLPNVVQAAWQLHNSVEALKVARTSVLTGFGRQKHAFLPLSAFALPCRAKPWKKGAGCRGS